VRGDERCAPGADRKLEEFFGVCASGECFDGVGGAMEDAMRDAMGDAMGDAVRDAMGDVLTMWGTEHAT
jgi:hypothetical protein